MLIKVLQRNTNHMDVLWCVVWVCCIVLPAQGQYGNSYYTNSNTNYANNRLTGGTYGNTNGYSSTRTGTSSYSNTAGTNVLNPYSATGTKVSNSYNNLANSYGTNLAKKNTGYSNLGGSSLLSNVRTSSNYGYQRPALASSYSAPSYSGNAVYSSNNKAVATYPTYSKVATYPSSSSGYLSQYGSNLKKKTYQTYDQRTANHGNSYAPVRSSSGSYVGSTSLGRTPYRATAYGTSSAAALGSKTLMSALYKTPSSSSSSSYASPRRVYASPSTGIQRPGYGSGTSSSYTTNSRTSYAAVPQRTSYSSSSRGLGYVSPHKPSYSSGYSSVGSRYPSYSSSRRTYAPASNSHTYRSSVYGVSSSSAIDDPCQELYEGDYVLTGPFKSLYPEYDAECYFVKCANKKSFINPCGVGTKNDEYGDGYCSKLDLAGVCGPSVHEYSQEQY